MNSQGVLVPNCGPSSVFDAAASPPRARACSSVGSRRSSATPSRLGDGEEPVAEAAQGRGGGGDEACGPEPPQTVSCTSTQAERDSSAVQPSARRQQSSLQGATHASPNRSAVQPVRIVPPNSGVATGVATGVGSRVGSGVGSRVGSGTRNAEGGGAKGVQPLGPLPSGSGGTGERASVGSPSGVGALSVIAAPSPGQPSGRASNVGGNPPQPSAPSPGSGGGDGGDRDELQLPQTPGGSRGTRRVVGLGGITVTVTPSDDDDDGDITGGGSSPVGGRHPKVELVERSVPGSQSAGGRSSPASTLAPARIPETAVAGGARVPSAGAMSGFRQAASRVQQQRLIASQLQQRRSTKDKGKGPAGDGTSPRLSSGSSVGSRSRSLSGEYTQCGACRLSVWSTRFPHKR